MPPSSQPAAPPEKALRLHARLRAAIAGALLGTLLFGHAAWLSTPSLPRISLAGQPFELPASGYTLLYVLLLGSAGFLFTSRWRGAAALHLLFWVVAIGLDQNLLQPHAFHFVLLLLALLLGPCKGEEATLSRTSEALFLILGAQMLFAGLGKLGAPYLEGTHWLLFSPLLPLLSGFPGELIRASAYLPPILEILVGLCLLLPPMRRGGIWGAVVVHTFAVALLGLLHGLEPITLPWNVGMLALLFLLRSCLPHVPDLLAWHPAPLRRGPWIAALSTGPLLFWMGFGLSAASYPLYTGNVPVAVFWHSSSEPSPLPKSLRPSLAQQRGEETRILLGSWAFAENTAGHIQEAWGYTRTFRALCERWRGRSDFRLSIFPARTWRADPPSELRCIDVLARQPVF